MLHGPGGSFFKKRPLTAGGKKLVYKDVDFSRFRSNSADIAAFAGHFKMGVLLVAIHYYFSFCRRTIQEFDLLFS